MGKGRFITLEGGEGAGKSTLARALSERLSAAGITARTTREPGGSPKAEAIRGTILAGQVRDFGPFAEALMFSAARIDHIDSLIRPALERGEWVICDRFIDSTRVYQGVLGKLDRALLAALEAVTVSGLMPELTLILDLDPQIGLARAAGRRRPGEAADRFEGETLAFHRNLRQAYLAIAQAEPQRCVVLDATQPPEALAEAAWRVLRERLPVDPEP
ncbi:dTMP kinase [Bosea sp. (in: a-proteobacteria)]|uniref:dTMP kinase n=1 Tax=Bosea sp. (in: a-proteobacteria) TaxID=1871050 RepID=UPI0026302B9D|nr:dTMP kinase [Bosea sp. (in: a-proteobacteria)]MCO5093345.1 dTMP kinase [Bosea sp. (in: a-proteobacteria)]